MIHSLKEIISKCEQLLLLQIVLEIQASRILAHDPDVSKNQFFRTYANVRKRGKKMKNDELVGFSSNECQQNDTHSCGKFNKFLTNIRMRKRYECLDNTNM